MTSTTHRPVCGCRLIPTREGPMCYDDPDPTCARCGSPCEWVECRDCGGNGYTHHMRCETCWGDGWWWECIADAAWCEANPLPGREEVERGIVEVIQ